VLGLSSTIYNKEKLKMALSNSQRDELLGLCIAMFNAAPGENYLGQLIAARESGSSLLDIANALATKPQLQLVYPIYLNVTPVGVPELVQRVSDNLLTSDTPLSARNWANSWIQEQLRGGAGIASVLQEAAQALMSTDNPAYASAKALMLNRIEVAKYYSVTQAQSSADIVTLQSVLADVTPAPASVAAAKAAIDSNPDSNEFTLTTGTDHLTGTDGDDRFIAGLNGMVFSESDKLDGGAGTDTLTIYTAPGTNDSFPSNATLSNIEVVNIYSAVATHTTVDASKFSGVSVINLSGGAIYVYEGYNSISNVADDQKVGTQGDAIVIASGYQSATETAPAVYAGTLDLTISPPTQYVVGGTTAHVYADTLNLTVMGGARNHDAVQRPGGNAHIDGDVKVAHVTLVPVIDNAGTPDISTDAVYEMPSFSLSAVSGPYPDTLHGLTTLALSGNGHADVGDYNQNLTTIDASGLDSRDIHGVVGVGLTLISANTVAETIKLSSGLDQLHIVYSTVTNTDTIEGFTLVDDANAAGKQVDLNNSDRLALGAQSYLDQFLNRGFVQAGVSADSLDEALTTLAASTNAKVVFHFGDNTYIYWDLANDGGASDTADATDTLVKLTGTLDLDLLVATLDLAVLGF
jgi:hypothetical protein